MTGLGCQAGTILVEDGTILPGAMAPEHCADSQSWGSMPNLDRIGLEALLAKAGWTFFYMAGLIKRYAFGSGAEKRLHTAVERVIQDVHSQKCNCLEITRIAKKSFLGVPYVSVTAHARHIQDGCQFRGR